MPDEPTAPHSPEPRPTPSPGALFDLGFNSAPKSSSSVWQPPTVEELRQALPQYEITALIARGGMGAVYKGTQKTLRRAVAIKVLPPGIEDGDLQFAARFKHEAQAMAQLSHPGIVAVHDAGETPDGLLYFVMEFIEGTDLAQLISGEGRIEPRRALGIITEVCDALAFAHESGIIHRDIKPSNIMLDRRGHVKVADFGLAKAVNIESTLLTGSNVTMGTPDFIAPEALIVGIHVDQRADLYAVGVMLYQMLTGHIPRGRFEPPSGAVPGLDQRFDHLVDHALQPDREKRYSTAIEMRRDIEPILTGSLATAISPPDSARRKKALILVGVAAATLALGSLFVFPRPPAKTIDPAPDRQAALLALQKGGLVTIQKSSGAPQIINSASALPEGTFALVGVEVRGSKGATTFGDADMTAFTGLPKLQRLILDQTRVTGASLAVLKTLPTLRELELDRNKTLRDDDLKQLGECRSLDSVILRHADMFTAAGLDHLFELGQLRSIEIHHLALRPEDVKHVLRLSKLESVNVVGLKADGLEQLQGLPRLQSLAISAVDLERPISFASFPKLTKIRVIDGMTPNVLASLATATKLEDLIVIGTAMIDAESWRKLATTVKGVRYLTLALLQPLPSGDPLAGLDAWPKLERVQIGNSSGVNQFDDAALLSLAKVPTLKTIRFETKSHRVTSQGRADFQKLRPEVKLEVEGGAKL